MFTKFRPYSLELSETILACFMFSVFVYLHWYREGGFQEQSVRKWAHSDVSSSSVDLE